MTKINQKKYINALLYFLENCNNKFLGKNKLNKLYYYLDFVYYKNFKRSVTGDVYFCEQFGPVPNSLDSIKSDAIKEKLIRAEITNNQTKKEKYYLIEKPDLSFFNSKELELLQKICEKFKSYNTNKIVDQTHFEAPWFYAELYEKIDYKYSADIEILD
jgi:uncharacterized phage-associated protein